MLLSISSTIHDIEKALKDKSLKSVASEMRVSVTKLRQILSMVGYEYDSSQKKWRYILLDERADQRHRTFWHLDEYGIGNPSNTDDESDMDEPIEVEEERNMGTFTVDEIAILKRLAARHADAASGIDSTDVLQALKNAPEGSTSKKTFALNDGVINQLDTFCDTHRVKKSDVLAVALQEFFKKYQIES